MGLVKSEADPKILEFKESRPREKSSLPQMGRRLRLFAIVSRRLWKLEMESLV